VNLTKAVIEIQLRSVRGAIHHLQSVDLDELAAGATVYGTPGDLDLIDAVRAFLSHLPQIHP
jgi:hypothetical protein